MERLTYKRKYMGDVDYYVDGIEQSSFAESSDEMFYGAAIDKLAKYEDTGLKPEDIPDAIEMCKINIALKELKEYEELENKIYNRWIPVKEELPSEKLFKGDGFLRRIMVAFKTDTVEYEFAYYDGYKWFDKTGKNLNVVAWRGIETYDEN